MFLLLICIRTGIIYDHNRNPVPDGTVVRFNFSYQKDINSTQQIETITTDGIAKGYIVDRASVILKNHGITNHLINAGGDIRTHGYGAKGKPWTIAIQDPSKKGDYPV